MSNMSENSKESKKVTHISFTQCSLDSCELCDKQYRIMQQAMDGAIKEVQEERTQK